MTERASKESTDFMIVLVDRLKLIK